MQDGPPLRASLLISFANHYRQTHPSEAEKLIKEELYDSLSETNSVIKADLDYVVKYWRETGFCLWEEVNGVSLHYLPT